MNHRRNHAHSADFHALEPRSMLTAAVSNVDVLASIGSAKGLTTLQSYLSSHPTAALGQYVDLKHSTQLFKNGNTSLLQLKLKAGATSAGAIKVLKAVAGTRWASPNYLYGKGGGERTPNDPRWEYQADPLSAIQLPQAWDVTLGSPNLTVAVLDDGFDASHEDLKGALWTNPGEIAGNGIDDDANGYVDDVHGYDFGKNDNDPSPAFDPTYNATDSHGTQVAGVIGAGFDNDLGIAGVAGGVRLMPVRFRGADVVVSSAGIAASVAYAANNGAKIINLSYSFDPYMNDPAFSAAVDLAYDKGVLWVNSAGNNSSANPPRTLIDKIVFVDNVGPDDVKYTDSNYGTGTDVSAPGVEIRASAPGNDYYPVTGTSFASAVTSGIAALIWSAHPTWTRDQVAAQLLGTVDAIDAKNPGYAGQLGTGRVNAYKAVTGTLTAPTVRGLVGIPDGGSLSATPTIISLGTYSVLDAATVKSSAFELRAAGTDGLFGTADDSVVPLTISAPYAYGSNRIDFTPGTALPAGNYRFTAKTTIADPFGHTLAAPFVSTFKIAPQVPAAVTGFAVAQSTFNATDAELKWDDTFANETGFTIERSTSPTFATIDRTRDAVANSTRYTDYGLTQGTTYYYRIRAVSVVGQGVNSATAVLAVPLPPAGIPALPTNFTVASESTVASDVQLRWKDNSSNETNFGVQRSTSATFATIDRAFTARPDSGDYVDWGLTAGTTYYYRLRAENGASVSDWTPTVTYKAPGGTTPAPTPTPTAPSALTGTAVAATPTSVTLAWTNTSTTAVTGYTVQRSTTAAFTTVDKTIPSTTATVVDTGLTAGATYYYRVAAVNGTVTSPFSAVLTYKAPAVTPPPAPTPTAPTALTGTAVAATPTSVTLAWTNTSTTAVTSYTVQRSTTAAFTTVDKTIPSTTATVVDTGLTAGATYYYRVAAVNGTVTSPYSAVLTYKAPAVTPPAPTPTLPAAPTKLAATTKSKVVTLTWTDNATNETGFVIERSLFSNFLFLTTTLTAPANATTLNDGGAIGGLTYYYRVKSTNALGVSAWSNTISIKVK